MRALPLDRRHVPIWQHPAVIALVAIGASLVYGIALASNWSLLVLIAIPVALVVAIVAFIRPEYAAVTLLVVEWGYISDIAVKYHGVPSISKPLVVLLAGILLMRRFFGRRKPLLYDAIIWWMLAYLLVVAFGLWYAYDASRTTALVVEVAKQVLMFVVLVNLITTEKSFELAMWLLLIVGAVLGTLTVIQEVTQTYGNNFGGLARMEISSIAEGLGDRPRAGGSTGSPLAYGQQLIVLVPIGLWGLLHSPTWPRRILAAYCTAAALAGIGLCFSRSTYIATAFVLVLFALHIKLNPKYLLLTVPLIGALLFVAPSEFTARVGTLSSFLPGEDSEGVRSEASFNRRSVEMLMAVNMFVDHPFIGVGGNNYPALYPQYIRESGSPVPDEERTPHNYYLEVAAESGLIGLIPWMGVVVLTSARLRSARRDFTASGDQRMAELAAGLEIGYYGYLVTSLFLHGAYSQFLWLQVGIAVALAAIARRSLTTATHMVASSRTV